MDETFLAIKLKKRVDDDFCGGTAMFGGQVEEDN